jgi:hypothetical protein
MTFGSRIFPADFEGDSSCSGADASGKNTLFAVVCECYLILQVQQKCGTKGINHFHELFTAVKAFKLQ